MILGGCPDDTPAKIGACSAAADCPSGICGDDAICVDPELDSDGDGLINRVEVQLGSDPLRPDTDGDGIPDGQEVLGSTNVDTDGDSIPDVLESATADADGDCITDQYDAENTVPNSDLSPMRDVVCPTVGLCAGVDRGLFGVLCPAGTAVCDFTNVPGYADPEGTCDGIDENCDGSADEGFDDSDGDGIADCVDADVDGDGLDDLVDNCPLIANPNQEDAQSDGVGDACASGYALAFASDPAATVAVGAQFEVAVELRDADGAVVPRFHGDVLVSLAAATGDAPTLSGTRSVTAVAGVATFTALAVESPGSGLSLHAASGDLAEAVGATFEAKSDQLGELRITSAPTSVTAGGSFSATVTAFDPFDGVLATYAGTVRLESSDERAILPAAPFTFAASDAGTHRFDGLVLQTAGEQTLRVVDPADDTVLASATLAVIPAAAQRFAIVGLPDEVVAGSAPALTIEARDAFGNLATAFTGTATFATDDPQGAVPSDTTFTVADAGALATTGFIPRTAGARTLTVDDVETHTMSVTATTAVVHAEAQRLIVTVLTTPVAAGQPLDVEVRVVDAFGNLVTDYEGPVALSSTDPSATLPASYTFTAADGGVHVFHGVVLVASGQQGVGAAASDVSGDAAITVESGSSLVLDVVGVPDPATAGAAFNVTVTVRDSFGNVVTDYEGNLELSSTDLAAVLPGPLTLTMADAGRGMFSGVELRTAGARTLTVADSAAGVSKTVNTTVKAAGAARMTVSGPTSATAGTPFTATVSVFDAYDNPATGYAGTLVFSSAQPAATLPDDTAFGSATGVRVVSGFVLEKVASAATVTVVDSGDAALTATLTLAVTPAAASRIALTEVPAGTVAGDPFPARVTVYDAYDNVATGFTGTIGLASSDRTAVLPVAHGFTSGDAGTFRFTGVTLEEAGSQTLTAADTANGALSQQVTVAVTAADAATLDVVATESSLAAGTPTSLVVTARDAFGNVATGYRGTVHVAAAGDDQATLPADAAFTAQGAGVLVLGGVVLRTVGAQTVTVTDTAAESVTGSVTITVGQGSNVRYVLSGLPATATAGDTLSVTVTVEDAFGNRVDDYVGTAHFSAADATSGQPVTGATLPADTAFTLANGGQRTFAGIVLRHAASTTIRVNDAGTPAIGSSAVVTVAPAAMSRLTLEEAPGSVVAGASFGLRVSAYDAFDNVATGYAGTVTFSSSDPAPTLPAAATLSGGSGSFSGFVLTRVPSQTVTVADGAVSDVVTIAVTPGEPASLTLSAPPATVTAGAPQTLTATVLDAKGNRVTGFTGSATVVTDDPAPYKTSTSVDFTAGDQGQRAISVTWYKPTTRTVTVDAGGPLVAARSTRVEPAGLARVAISGAPTTVVSQAPFGLTVTAYDQFDNVATGVTAPVSLTSSDPGATLPAAALVAGTKTLTGLKLKATPSQTVTATVSGKSDTVTIQVTPGTATTLELTALPADVVAGVAQSMTATVRDAAGNVASGFTGTASLKTDDPAPYATDTTLDFAAADVGVKAFQVTFKKVGARTVTVDAGSTRTASRSTTVKPAGLARVTISGAPATVDAGQEFGLTVTAYDAFDNVATGVTATVSLSSSDTGATLPAATALVAGTKALTGLKLSTVPSQTVTATASGKSDTVTIAVASGSATTLELTTLPASVVAGVAQAMTATVRDAQGNIATSFTGTATLKTTDPAPYTTDTTLIFAESDRGVKAFQVTFKKVGTRTVTVDAGGTRTASRSTAVTPAGLDKINISGAPATVVSQAPFGLTVTAYDQFDNVATGATGTVGFTSSDNGATLPAGEALVAGTKALTGLKLKATPSQTVTATVSGKSDTVTILVTPGDATTLELTALPSSVVAGVAQSMTATMRDAAGNVVTGFTGTASLKTDDPMPYQTNTSITFEAANHGVKTFDVALKKVGTRTVKVDAGGPLTASRSTAVTPATASSITVAPVTGAATAGDPVSFTVTLLDAYENTATGYRGTVTFQNNDPNQAYATAPADYRFTGNDAGAHEFAATFVTAGSQTLDAKDATLPGTETATLTRTVAPGALATLKLTPTTTTPKAGAKFDVAVVAKDTYDNTLDTSRTINVAYTATGTGPSTATFTGTTTLKDVIFTQAGAAKVTVTSDEGVSGQASVTVAPSDVTHVAFSKQPGSGYVGSALPTFRVALYDQFENVATNAVATSVSVAIANNVNQGHLTGTTTASTSAGVAAFSTVLLDKSGKGWTLAATSGTMSATSHAFDTSWPQPKITGATASGTQGCITSEYTLNQLPTGATDVKVEYRVGGGPFYPATQAPSGDYHGVNGLHGTLQGSQLSFLWDSTTDLGASDVSGVALRFTPRTGGSVGAPALTPTFAVSNGWAGALKAHPITATQLTTRDMAVADLDGDGLLDVALSGGPTASGVIELFYQTSPGTFSEQSLAVGRSLNLVALQAVSLGGLRPLDLVALQASSPSLLMYTWARNPNGGLGWESSSAPACSDQKDTAVDMAFGFYQAGVAQQVVVACADADNNGGPKLTRVANLGQGFGVVDSYDLGAGVVPTSVAAVDFGRDGGTDVVVGTTTGVKTFINNNDSGFYRGGGGAQTIALDDGTTDLAVGDLNNDGFPDVVAVRGDDKIAILAGQASPFLSAPDYRVVGTKASRVTIGDVDGDGILDLILGSYDGDAVQILRGDGALGFTALETFATGQTATGVVALDVVDLEHNGKPTIVAARAKAGAGASWVDIQPMTAARCRPGFSGTAAAPSPVAPVRTFLRDVNGDGKPDVGWIAQDYGASSSGVTWGLGDGGGSFTQGPSYYSDSQYAVVDGVLGDFNADGLVDAFLVAPPEAFLVYRDTNYDGGWRRSSTTFPTPLSGDYNRDRVTAAGDLDGDGREDLAYITTSRTGVWLRFYRQATGETFTASTTSLGADPAWGLALGDVNRDGFLDAAFVRGANAPEICVVLSSSGPSWPSTVPAGSCFPASDVDGALTLDDVDGDGDLELLYLEGGFSSPTALHVRSQSTPGSGVFDQDASTAVCHSANEAVVADFDGDGRRDVVVACGGWDGYYAHTAEVYFQRADETFDASNMTGIGPESSHAWPLAAGDVDGDLIPDVVMKDGVVHSESLSPGEYDDPRPVAMAGSVDGVTTADFNGDGLNDVLTWSGYSATMGLTLADGPGGAFGDASEVTLAGASAIGAVTAADLDGDGRVEIAVARGGAQTGVLEFYRQTAPGSFSSQPVSYPMPGAPTAMAVGKLFEREVSDVVVAYATGLKVFGQANNLAFGSAASMGAGFPTDISAVGLGYFGDALYYTQVVDWRTPIVAGHCPGTSQAVPCLVIAEVATPPAVPSLRYQVKTDGTTTRAGAAFVALAVTNLNLDRWDDVVTLRDGSYVTFDIFVQDPAKAPAFFPAVTIYGPPGTGRAMQLADVDGDGRDDIVVLYESGASNAVAVLFRVGATDDVAFSEPTSLVTPFGYQSSLAIGDMDRDGGLDLLVPAPHNSEVLIFPRP